MLAWQVHRAIQLAQKFPNKYSFPGWGGLYRKSSMSEMDKKLAKVKALYEHLKSIGLDFKE